MLGMEIEINKTTPFTTESKIHRDKSGKMLKICTLKTTKHF